MADLQEIEAIKRLKYRYLRCLDEKRWEEMTECFTADATSAYGDGDYSFAGRDQIVQFLREALGSPSIISAHRVQQPEIDLTSATTATGVWALDDTVMHTESKSIIRGAAFYHDEYVKIGGQWKIKSTGYQRLFEERLSRVDTPSWRLTANRWAKGEKQ
ncbi:MAG TPA: nuclear transport factor 2 family protein [Candidatus Margulisiibacteriota bacterium]|nr:nuclear transport factor 2 family protein [Candidatus Margulisiibacteriota bacterium]